MVGNSQQRFTACLEAAGGGIPLDACEAVEEGFKVRGFHLSLAAGYAVFRRGAAGRVVLLFFLCYLEGVIFPDALKSTEPIKSSFGLLTYS